MSPLYYNSYITNHIPGTWCVIEMCISRSFNAKSGDFLTDDFYYRCMYYTGAITVEQIQLLYGVNCIWMHACTTAGVIDQQVTSHNDYYYKETFY